MVLLCKPQSMHLLGQRAHLSPQLSVLCPQPPDLFGLDATALALHAQPATGVEFGRATHAQFALDVHSVLLPLEVQPNPHMRGVVLASVSGLAAAVRLVPQPFYASDDWRATRLVASVVAEAWERVNATRLEVREGAAYDEVVPWLSSVEFLRFCGAGLGPSSARVLCGTTARGLAVESDIVESWALDRAAARFPRITVGDAEDPEPSRLEELSLRRCQLDGTAARSLARLLRLYPELKALYLGTNPLGFEGARALCDALVGGFLETLELSECDLDDQACRTLARALKTVRHLDLSRNPNVGGLGVAAIVRRATDLRTLDVSGCGLADGADALADALRGATGLNAIALANTRLAPAAAARVLLALAKQPGLRVLDLSSNHLTPRAFKEANDSLLDRLFNAAKTGADDHQTCAICCAAAALRRPNAFPALEVLRLCDVGALEAHERLLGAALAKTPRPNLHLDLRANPRLDAKRSKGDPPLVS